MDQIKHPKVICGKGADTSIKIYLSNIRDLIHNLDEKNEDSDIFIIKSIEEGKIKPWETLLEYLDHLLQDIAESADKFRKILIEERLPVDYPFVSNSQPCVAPTYL